MLTCILCIVGDKKCLKTITVTRKDIFHFESPKSHTSFSAQDYYIQSKNRLLHACTHETKVFVQFYTCNTLKSFAI